MNLLLEDVVFKLLLITGMALLCMYMSELSEYCKIILVPHLKVGIFTFSISSLFHFYSYVLVHMRITALQTNGFLLGVSRLSRYCWLITQQLPVCISLLGTQRGLECFMYKWCTEKNPTTHFLRPTTKFAYVSTYMLALTLTSYLLHVSSLTQ